MPTRVFTPDDTFAEEIFAKSISIAWLPKSFGVHRLNRLLRSLECPSFAESLRSQAAKTITILSNDKPRFLTPATKEVLMCWVCATEGWNHKRPQLEQLLWSNEAQVAELHVDYWLDVDTTPPTSVEANAFWASQNRLLLLRQDATLKAQQSAVAASIAAQLGRTGKQNKDTVQCLLGLEISDGRRELAERKWELTSEQKAWLQSIGYKLEVVEVCSEIINQNERESRPAITSQLPSGNGATTSSSTPSPAVQPSTITTPLTLTKQASQPSPDNSQTVSVTNRPSEQTNVKQQIEANKVAQPNLAEESDSAYQLKSPDSDAEFIQVVAHTRQRPRRERQQRESGERESQEQHPMAGIPNTTKAEIEDAAIRLILRQFQHVPMLREFKVHDERKRNHGYDILAIKPGHALRIEIKAHLHQAKSVFVTQNEWQQSRLRNSLAADDKWELWNVENLAAEAGRVRITRYAYLPDEARTRESGYWVDLNACNVGEVEVNHVP